MSDTMKVKPWGSGQGDHVLIDAAAFDPAVHVPLDANEPAGDGAPADAPRRGRRKATDATTNEPAGDGAEG